MRREELDAMEKPELIKIIMSMTEELAELRASLNQNSSNSSKPPSSDPPWNKPKSTRSPSGKKPGGQFGHKGHGLKFDLTPDKTVDLKPETCTGCGADLSGEEGVHIDTRYKIDVQIKTVVTVFRIYDTKCQKCGKINKSKLPNGLEGSVQYGEGVRAMSVLLTHYAMVGYDKTSKIMRDVFGVPMSAGTVVNITKAFADKGKSILSEISAKLKSSDILHNDETGTRVNGKTYWLHTASNAKATYNTVHEKRGREGIDDNGVLKDFTGTSVHDFWSPYLLYKNCKHASCGAHLLRELTAVSENASHRWADDMKKLMLDMKSAVDRYKLAGKEELSRYYQKKFADEYDRIIQLGEIEAPPPKIPKSKRGKARCLLDRFINKRTEIFRFSDDFSVPFDNNQAERDIRIAKVKQKVSGGFRTDTGAKNFGKISSIIGTAVKQGLSVFKTIVGVISGTVNTLFDRESDENKESVQGE